MNEFKQLLSKLQTESDLVDLTAKLMQHGVWAVVADAVLDRCNEIGGEDMEDRVYDKAHAIAH